MLTSTFALFLASALLWPARAQKASSSTPCVNRCIGAHGGMLRDGAVGLDHRLHRNACHDESPDEIGCCILMECSDREWLDYCDVDVVPSLGRCTGAATHVSAYTTRSRRRRSAIASRIEGDEYKETTTRRAGVSSDDGHEEEDKRSDDIGEAVASLNTGPIKRDTASDGKRRHLNIAVGVGLAAGLPLVFGTVGLVAFLCWRKKRKPGRRSDSRATITRDMLDRPLPPLPQQTPPLPEGVPASLLSAGEPHSPDDYELKHRPSPHASGTHSELLGDILHREVMPSELAGDMPSVAGSLSPRSPHSSRSPGPSEVSFGSKPYSKSILS